MKSENIVLAVAFCPDTDYFPKKPTPSLFQSVVFASIIITIAIIIKQLDCFT